MLRFSLPNVFGYKHTSSIKTFLEEKEIVSSRYPIYPYKSAAPAMAPPPWDVMKSKAFIGDILRVTNKASDMTGFKWAPNQHSSLVNWSLSKGNNRKGQKTGFVITWDLSEGEGERGDRETGSQGDADGWRRVPRPRYERATNNENQEKRRQTLGHDRTPKI